MIVDTSALVALVSREPGWQQIVECLESDPSVRMSAVSVVELGIVLASPRFGLPMRQVQELLARVGVGVLDFSFEHALLAVDAHGRFGPGHHAARLNFGDCVSYATAQLAGEPLLFVGDDFPLTDIEPALSPTA